MKRNKNIVTLALMICSLVLLIVLQIFWIQSAYEKAFHGLRRESSMIFRTTVMTMRDSMFLRNIETVPADVLPSAAAGILQKDSLQKILRVQSSHSRQIRDHGPVERIEVFTTVDGKDTALHSDFLRPLASRIQSIRTQHAGGEVKGFIIRLTPDTLNMDTLKLQFHEALAKAATVVPFSIRRTTTGPPDGNDHPGPLGFAKEVELNRENERRSEHAMYGDSLSLDAVRINPITRYSATLANVRGVIWAQITPQILFSVFLTMLTVTAFLVMYRNLTAQQRLMDAKTDFINNVTHELKTPVATVSVAIEALRNFHAIDNPKLTEEYLDIAQHELNRLSLMTDKILKTAVFETSGVSYRAETIDLDATTQQIMASMKMVFEKRGATVRYMKEGNNFTLRGGTIHITNVIYNLIDNALKYSTGNPVITVSLNNTSDSVSLSVKDEGPGIAPEYQKKIFEKFFRVPTGDVHNAKGYGLGLNYVASVMKSHEGTINVESTLGKGSCFTITLPRQIGTIA